MIRYDKFHILANKQTPSKSYLNLLHNTNASKQSDVILYDCTFLKILLKLDYFR